MKRNLMIISLILASLSMQAQNFLINFQASGSSSNVESVFVENLTQGTSLELAGNDFLNLVVTVGESEIKFENKPSVFIFPNPSTGSTKVSFESKLPGNTTIALYEISGKKILQTQEFLLEGQHTFKLNGITNGIYLLKISADEFAYSTRFISLDATSGKPDISYIGTTPVIENHETGKSLNIKSTASTIEMNYTLDDYLKITGKSGIYRNVIILKPTQSQTVTFNFVPCIDADNNNYPTLQIGTQLWMAENLNVGVRINGNQSQSNNGTIEKYYYNDNVNNGEVYGGLYSWNEMMKYNSTEGMQGICPNGWHLPTDQDWGTLVNYLTTASGPGGKMKETGSEHWLNPNNGATNESGFTARPGGERSINSTFQNLTYYANFWSSTQNSTNEAWKRSLNFNNTDAVRNVISKETGNSCRCIQNNSVELAKLAGENTKTWKLIRDVSTGRYPLEVGPYDHSYIWWAMGLNNNELVNRSCMLNDEWTFSRDGSMVFDAKGDYWAEGSVFPDDADDICASTSNPMVNYEGEDVSAWGNGNHEFQLITGSSQKLKVIGNGAYLGLCKVGTEYEFIVPQDSVRYNLIKLYDGTTDTLIVETPYYFSHGDTQYGGYWRFVLVHYDNPADEPPIPGDPPTAGFSYTLNNLTATFSNTSTMADYYYWDFGDGATSTEINPVHSYSQDGFFTVTLTAYNDFGQDSYSTSISTGVISYEQLIGSAWRIPVSQHSIYVGPGIGSDAWWIVPISHFDGTEIGTTDDWSCMINDEFIFSADGNYTYETNGSSRNDGYFGQPNGCWSDEEIANSGNGAAFGSCNTHTFEFTPATETTRAIITLTNGPGFAAFIGFYKGYYGGENTDGANPPNGGYTINRYEVVGYGLRNGKEYMIVSVDISADHSGWASWTIELERIPE